eukprot:6785598-Pyramimonas_sp.AAC.1
MVLPRLSPPLSRLLHSSRARLQRPARASPGPKFRGAPPAFLFDHRASSPSCFCRSGLELTTASCRDVRFASCRHRTNCRATRTASLTRTNPKQRAGRAAQPTHSKQGE